MGQQWRRLSMRKRVAWDSFYGRAAWRRLRQHQLRAQPLCQMCLKEGRTTPAEVVDHVVPHRGDWTAFRCGALQSLCKRCHDSTKKTIENKGFDPAIGADGYPLDPKHPVYQTGAARSGRFT
jgi:5-methylcytosine-specific restriction enzyme A